jgi:hypothetical protein
VEKRILQLEGKIPHTFCWVDKWQKSLKNNQKQRKSFQLSEILFNGFPFIPIHLKNLKKVYLKNHSWRRHHHSVWINGANFF